MVKLNKTRAFLTEFIIVILFFSVAAVITMELYVEAHNMSEENIHISNATMYAQSAAENIRAGSVYFGKDGIFSEYLDENMEITDETSAVYLKKVVVSVIDEESGDNGTMRSYKIIISDAESGKEWYSLEFKQYERKEVQ